MSPDQMQNTAIILLLLAVVPAIMSILFHALTPWRETEIGQHLLAYAGATAVVLLIALLNNMQLFAGMWFQYVNLATFAALPVVLWWRVVIQLRAYVGAPRD